MSEYNSALLQGTVSFEKGNVIVKDGRMFCEIIYDAYTNRKELKQPERKTFEMDC